MAKQNKKNIFLVIIILALIGYILYDKGVFSDLNFSKDNKEEIFVFDDDQEVETQEITETNNTEVEKPQLSEAESCEVEVLKEVTDKNIDYTKGFVLVSFSANTSFNEAKNIILDLNYSIRDESASKNRFESGNNWFIAKVGTGNEFRAICTLRENNSVKYAFIEPLLEIHE